MEFLALFRDWKDVVEFEADTIIFSEGDPADFMYVILAGEVELSLRGDLLGTEKTGGIIGEMAIIESATRSATSRAITDVKLARLDHGQFKEFVGQNTEFSFHVMAVLANRLRAVDRYITAQM